MEATQAIADITDLRARLRSFQRIVALLALTCLVLAWAVMKQVGLERTHLVPPEVSKAFWLSGDRVSAAYLEQMGEFIAHQMLDVSPAAFSEKRRVLEKWICSEAQPRFKNQLDWHESRVREHNATTTFFPTRYTARPDDFSLLVSGRLSTFINDARTSEAGKTFLIEFAYPGGQLCVRGFKEVADTKDSSKEGNP